MVELNFDSLPHAMALTGPLETAKAEAWRIAEKLVGDVRLGVLWIEPEGPAIKLEAAQRINDFLSLSRLGRARVIIVSEAHTLNAQATNAILKIVEEPPPATHFLFLATEISQLLPTLRSRLQVLRLKPEPRHLDQEMRELRDASARFLTACFAHRREGVNDLLEAAKDRESAGQAARLLQQLLRDWSVFGSGQELHADAKAEISQWPQWASFEKVKLWNLAHQVESDLHGNVDRSLVFENFYYRVRDTQHVD